MLSPGWAQQSEAMRKLRNLRNNHTLPRATRMEVTALYLDLLEFHKIALQRQGLVDKKWNPEQITRKLTQDHPRFMEKRKALGKMVCNYTPDLSQIDGIIEAHVKVLLHHDWDDARKEYIQKTWAPHALPEQKN